MAGRTGCGKSTLFLALYRIGACRPYTLLLTQYTAGAPLHCAWLCAGIAAHVAQSTPLKLPCASWRPTLHANALEQVLSR